MYKSIHYYSNLYIFCKNSTVQNPHAISRFSVMLPGIAANTVMVFVQSAVLY